MEQSMTSKTGSVHIMELEKAKRVKKVYAVIGQVIQWILGLIGTAGAIWVIWYMFTANFVAATIIFGVAIVLGAIYFIGNQIADADDVIDRAKTYGTVDD